MTRSWLRVVLLLTLALCFPSRNALAAPIVSISINPGSPLAGQLVEFDGTSTTDSDPLRTFIAYTWDFGDGQTASGPTPIRAYLANGSFLVSLTVENDLHETGVATQLVTVGQVNANPIADPGGPYVVFLGDGITLDGSGSMDPDLGDSIASYEWDIVVNDDGVVDASGVNPFISPEHISFLGLGEYPLRLRVTDTVGHVNGATTTLTIASPTSVPEPSSLFLLSAGCAALFAESRRRRRLRA
jgi:PKD repeat protein